MSDMVEWVALAISGSDDPANVLSVHRSRARVAIWAMREPTDEMKKAARYYLGAADVTTAWHAMIDEALIGKER